MKSQQSSCTKLPTLILSTASTAIKKQSKVDSTTATSRSSLLQLPSIAADIEDGKSPSKSRTSPSQSPSKTKALVEEKLFEIADAQSKGIVGYNDFAWLHVKLLGTYGDKSLQLKEKLESCCGGGYPQQVFRKFDKDGNAGLDSEEWRAYTDGLTAVLGRYQLQEMTRDLERQQQKFDNSLSAKLGRYNAQVSRQLLEKVINAQFLSSEHEVLAEALLEKMADPNYADRHGNTVVWHAASKCDVSFMARLLAQGGNASQTSCELDSPILAAARARRFDVLRLLLLGSNAEAEQKSSVSSNPRMGTGEIARTTESQEQERLASLCSAKLVDEMAKLSVKDIRDLVHKGADINYRNNQGWTILGAATFWDRKESVECIVRLPTMYTRLRLKVDLPDSRGRTPLHIAARKGLQDIVPILISGRANVNAQDAEGWTPLHHAVFNNQSDVILKLMEVSDIDPKVRSNEGFTPCMLLTSPNGPTQPLSKAASDALQPPGSIHFAKKIMPILKDEALSLHDRLEEMLSLHGAQSSVVNLRLPDQCFHGTRGPNKVQLAKLYELLGKEMISRLFSEDADLDLDGADKDPSLPDQHRVRLQQQHRFVDAWLSETSGPPRSPEWSFDNREGYGDDLAAHVEHVLQQFRKRADELFEAALLQEGGSELEDLPSDEVLIEEYMSQESAHEPLEWLSTKDVTGAFMALRSVKAFGENGEEDCGQALTGLIDLISCNPDFGSGPCFWRHIYKLWLASYASLANHGFHEKVKKLVASFNKTGEGMEVEFHAAAAKPFNRLKARERKLGLQSHRNGLCPAAQMLDVVRCTVTANSPAAALAFVEHLRSDADKMISTVSTLSKSMSLSKRGKLELVRVRSSFSRERPANLDGARSILLNVVYHGGQRKSYQVDDAESRMCIVGEVKLMLPEFLALQKAASPLVRHLEREADLAEISREQ